jgi:8-oxo-dGTP pyrophosphatase MutT (NUDIX family)
MGKKEFATFTISQVGLLFRDNTCLVLEFSDSKRWGFPGGRIDKGEEDMSESAFRRELKEEMGWQNVIIGSLIDYRTWNAYGEGKSTVVYAIETNEPIVLSFEHSSYRFIQEEEISKLSYAWPDGEKILKKGFEYYRSRNSL